ALRLIEEGLPIPAPAIHQGLAEVQLPGRFQVLPGAVTWILDVAHNGESAAALAANLRAFRCPGRLRAVFAVLSDKSPERMVEHLRDLIDGWYLTQTADERALPAEALAARLSGLLPKDRYQVFEDIGSAIAGALADAQGGDCLLVFGSFTTVAAALRHPSLEERA
ncbi:MAG: bifunctional folylpolyglutamate synthase/dihydrofolate synthase, partial [Rhodocyclaceae bacterium]|nr:bifunctional folylpolyglutamate synthase/dihydrofolate synthase [Rhodocyclaceae bacterium]